MNKHGYRICYGNHELSDKQKSELKKLYGIDANPKIYIISTYHKIEYNEYSKKTVSWLLKGLK